MMKRLLGGGLVFGLAAFGSIALAAPSSAQEPLIPGGVELQGELIPGDVVAPGDEVTAISIDSCTLAEGAGELYWAMGSLDEEEPRDEGVTELDEVGGWEVTFTAPEEPGEFAFIGVCLPEGVESEEPLDVTRLAEEVPEEEIVVEYYLLPFTVEGTTPTTTPPAERPEAPEAPPATPVEAEP
ncbi:MAG TPA: hypothetical protein VF152_02735, partial [Acidimicrobiia bacterium]